MRSFLFFSRFILRPLRRDPMRAALTALAIALGVAVVLAIELAGQAAAGSFHSSVETLAGDADLEVSAPGGIPASAAGELLRLPYTLDVRPRIEDFAELPRTGRVVPFIGVDMVANAVGGGDGQSDAADLEDLATGHRIWLGVPFHKKRGDRIELLIADRAVDFTVQGTLAARNGEVAVVDLSLADALLHRQGRLDRILVRVPTGRPIGEWQSILRSSLTAGAAVEPQGARTRENRKMLEAFRWNLRVLSYIALVVGAFLIYNTISISVVRRRTEIGILRALGTSRSAVFFLFLSEAILLGLTGSALGLAVGRVMASATVGLISQTVSALYTSSTPGAIQLTWISVAEAMAAGTLLAILSAAAPAREAMGVTPAEAMSRGSREHEARLHAGRDAGIAAVLAVLAVLASRGEPIDGKPIWGYVATMLSIGVAAFLAPAVVLGIVRGLRGFARRAFQAPGLLAGRSLTASLARTSIVVGALATAIAMMISVAIMVGSFRETVILWLDTQLRADLYVAPAAPSGAGIIPPLPREVPGIAAQLPGVADTDVLYALEFHYGPDRSTLGGVDTDVLRRYGHLRFLAGEGNRDAVLASLPRRDRVIISEPFSNKHKLHTGDTLELNLGSHRVRFHIAGVYFDYSSERGFVMLDRTTLLKYLPGQPPTNLAVYVKPGTAVKQVQDRLRDALAAYAVNIAPNETLRRGAIVVFDRTFAITWALEGVAIIVAMLGAANSLLALVLDRRRDLGLLQYLGAAGSQIRRMILVEAGFIGLMASVLGLTLGSALSLVLIYVINKQSFGWTIQFHPPLTLVGGALLLVWSFTVLAGLYPARVASRLNPIEVIHEE